MDWIKKGWGSNYQQEFSPSLPYHMDFSDYTDTDIRPIDAAINTIHRIAQSYPAPFTLFVSGGVDSQAMLYAWKRAGVPFKVISVIYVTREKQLLNGEDIEMLNAFSELHEISVEFKTFELIDFLEKDLPTYAELAQCISPQICVHMRLSEMVQDGTVLFSGNFFYNTPSLDYTILGFYRYTVATSRKIIPYFFIHDKEIVGSFHNFATSINTNGVTDPYLFKCRVYKEAGFEIIPQQFKMTGFEKVKDYYDQYPELVTAKEQLQFSKFASRRIFDLIFRYRFTRTIKYVDQIVVNIKKGLNEFPNRF